MEHELKRLNRFNRATLAGDYKRGARPNTATGAAGHQFPRPDGGGIGKDGRGEHMVLNRDSQIDASWGSELSLPTYSNINRPSQESSMTNMSFSSINADDAAGARNIPFDVAGGEGYKRARDDSFGPSQYESSSGL